MLRCCDGAKRTSQNIQERGFKWPREAICYMDSGSLFEPLGEAKCRWKDRVMVYVRVTLIGCVQYYQQGRGSQNKQRTENNFG